MKEPRYTVGTVTGWPISNTLRGNQRSKPSTVAYVYDSAYCYQPVAYFRPGRHHGPHGRLSETEAAERLAAELNRPKPVPPPTPPPPPRSARKRPPRPPKPKPKALPPPMPVVTEYLGYVIYVGPNFFFVYDHERNLIKSTRTMLAARRAIKRSRREARRETG